MNKRPVRVIVQAGFSLAELMIAIGILGIGLLIVAMAFPVAIDQARRGVELNTAQLVFKEAKAVLETYITGPQLAMYTDPNSTQFNSLAMRSGGKDIWWLFFVTREYPYRRVFDKVYSYNPDDLRDPNAADCVYDADATYGWLAAVEKVGSYREANGRNRGFYKFWIFVVREPTGMGQNDVGLKLGLEKFSAQRLGSRKIKLYPGATTEQPPVGRGMYFLGDNAAVYKVQDTDLGNDNTVLCAVDADLPGRDGDALFVAYPVPFSDQVRLTRRAPTVAVFETVIGYEE